MAVLSPNWVIVAWTAAIFSGISSTMTRRRSAGSGIAPDVAGLLEPVDDARDGARREAHQLGQPARRRGAAVEQDGEGFDVRLGQAEADRHGLSEERALEVHPAQRADDGIDRIAVHG